MTGVFGMGGTGLANAPDGPPIRPRVSAVIVSFHTGPCLWASLGAALDDPDINEVIVVDNGNPQDVTEGLRELAASRSKLKLETGHGNVGFARGCNLGAQASSGDLLLFLNPDLALRPRAVSRLLRAYAHRSARGPIIVGGRLLAPSGAEQRGSRRDIITPWSAFVSFSGLGALEKLHPALREPHRNRDPLPVGPQRVGSVSGAMLLVSKADYADLEGFDEGYFLHVEDLDLCRRAWAAGGEVIFTPDAEGVHIGCTSKASRLFVERYKAQGFSRYFERFAEGPVERAVVAAVTPAFAAAFTLRGVLKDGPAQVRSYVDGMRTRLRARRAAA